jgi:hypothetical protein
MCRIGLAACRKTNICKKAAEDEPDQASGRVTTKSQLTLQFGRHLMVRGTPNDPPTGFNNDELVARYIS